MAQPPLQTPPCTHLPPIPKFWIRHWLRGDLFQQGKTVIPYSIPLWSVCVKSYTRLAIKRLFDHSQAILFQLSSGDLVSDPAVKDMLDNEDCVSFYLLVHGSVICLPGFFFCYLLFWTTFQSVLNMLSW